MTTWPLAAPRLLSVAVVSWSRTSKPTATPEILLELTEQTPLSWRASYWFLRATPLPMGSVCTQTCLSTIRMEVTGGQVIPTEAFTAGTP